MKILFLLLVSIVFYSCNINKFSFESENTKQIKEIEKQILKLQVQKDSLQNSAVYFQFS